MSFSEDINNGLGPLTPESSDHPVLNTKLPSAAMAEQLAPFLAKKQILFTQTSRDGLFYINSESAELTELKSTAFSPWLSQYITLHDGDREADIKMETVRSVMQAPQLLTKLPKLRTVNQLRLPYFKDPAKSIIDLLPTGYHAATETYTAHSHFEFDLDWSAEQAKDYLIKILDTFPFALEGQEEGCLRRSILTQINAMLTVFCAQLFPWGTTFPLFAFIANMPGGGKSILAELAIMSVHGKASQTSYKNDSEWFVKELDSRARNYSPYLFMDNVSGIVASDALEAWLTEGERESRNMHSHDSTSVSKRCVSFLTGNNIRMSQDIRRRAEIVLLESDGSSRERQEERSAEIEIDKKWILDKHNRNQVLASLWALVRTWSENHDDTKPFKKSSFTPWAKVIPSITAYTFGGDPLKEAIMTNAGDIYEQHLQTMIKEMIQIVITNGHGVEEKEGRVPCHKFRPKEIAAVCRKAGLYENILGDIDSMARELESRGSLKAHGRGDNYVAAADLTDEEKYEQCWDVLDRGQGIKLGQLLTKAHIRKFRYPISSGVYEEWTLTPSAKDNKGMRYELRRVGFGKITEANQSELVQ